MRSIRIPRQISRVLGRFKRQGKTIGFVPTMGCLHRGHISLIEAARRNNDIVVASIFVNPAQFGPKEDYKKYPRTLKQDIRLLKAARCDILFCPSVKDMYPDGFATAVRVKGLPEKMCGLSRPGHFDGVTTVCAKLFNIVRPDTAYFGQKDYQQFVIIRKIVRDLDMGLKVKVMPIVREKTGLAMSSRNKYLTPRQGKDAAVLYAALRAAKAESRHEKNASKIISGMRRMISSKKNIKIDYITIVDAETLEKKSVIDNRSVIALAAWVGKARLIDNVIL